VLFFFSFFIFSRCWEQWEQRDDWVTAVLLSNTLALWKERELSDMAPLAFGEPAWYECTKEYAFFFHDCSMVLHPFQLHMFRTRRCVILFTILPINSLLIQITLRYPYPLLGALISLIGNNLTSVQL